MNYGVAAQRSSRQYFAVVAVAAAAAAARAAVAAVIAEAPATVAVAETPALAALAAAAAAAAAVVAVVVQLASLPTPSRAVAPEGSMGVQPDLVVWEPMAAELARAVALESVVQAAAAAAAAAAVEVPEWRKGQSVRSD